MAIKALGHHLKWRQDKCALNAGSELPMLYFAYGSNMWTPRLRYRVRSAKAQGIAQLDGFTLRWHKKSKDGSGKCNAFRTAGATLIGVLFQFDMQEKGALDAAEGLGFGYNEQKVNVHWVGRTTSVFLYVADTNYIDGRLIPYSWYKNFVVSGAKEHSLPNDYIATIEAQPAQIDPNATRERDEKAKVVTAA